MKVPARRNFRPDADLKWPTPEYAIYTTLQHQQKEPRHLQGYRKRYEETRDENVGKLWTPREAKTPWRYASIKVQWSTVKGQIETGAKFKMKNFVTIFSAAALTAGLAAGQSTTFTWSGCHYHGDSLHCAGPSEQRTTVTPTAVNSPEQKTGCFTQDNSTFCFKEGGHDHDHDHESPGQTNSTQATSTSAGHAHNGGASITGCHFHGTTQYCVDSNGVEGVVEGGPTATGSAVPSQYTGCHQHGDDTYCLAEDGEEVEFVAEEEGESHESHEGHNSTSASAAESTSSSVVTAIVPLPLVLGTVLALLIF